jgi:hypothetical protein
LLQVRSRRCKRDLGNITLNNSVFSDITPCSPFKVNRHFGGICSLHRRNKKRAWSRQHAELQAGFVLRLLFYPEDGGHIFHRELYLRIRTWKCS